MKSKTKLEVVRIPRRRRRRTLGIVAVALVALAAIAAFRRPLLSGNFGVVDPGLVYRCAQPKGNLERLLDAYRPASVLNLRGGSDADAWYAAEVEATRARGIDFYDFPISAVRRPSRRELLLLLDLLSRCRYPLLIHCKSGADRTGLVSGLYLMDRRGEPPGRALDAFSLAYGHVPLLGPERLHEPFLEYDAWLKARGLAHTPGRLRAWVARDYRADDPPRDAVPALRPGPRNRSHGPLATSSPD